MIENPTIRSILDRRSVRKYETKEIDQEVLETLLKVAEQAPSAKNQQSCLEIVVRDQQFLEEMDNAFMDVMVRKHDRTIPKGYLFHDAPCIIMLPRDASNIWSREDSGILAQTISIAAHSLGLGTCIIGLIRYLADHESVQEFYQKMQIPEGYALDLCVSVGYPAEMPTAKPRKNIVQWQS